MSSAHSPDFPEAPPPPPPSKRARTDTYRSTSAGNGEPTPPTQPPRTRGISACQTCRSRKTRCDNQRPSCSYCIKTGGNCEYLVTEQSAVLCRGVGPQLLQAIENLTTVIQQTQQTRREDSDYPHHTQSLDFQPSPSASFHSQCSPRRQDLNCTSLEHSENINRGEQRRGTRLSPTAGPDSILEWTVFPKKPQFSIFPSGAGDEVAQSHSLPNLEPKELSRLESKFINHIHTKNPILDLHTLRSQVNGLGENGLDWSTSTCLVALVCALGAISQRYDPSPRSQNDESLGEVHSREESKLASQWWGIAAKRLGFVIGKSNIEAIQCLCLTGIWYMYNMEPLQAWKFFNLASNAWYTMMIGSGESSIRLKEGAHELQHSLTLEQSLYFTCYKSECEITFELSLPSSALADFEYPYSFPSPPDLDSQLIESDLVENQRRTWYYYLAEIACRHLVNRIVEAHENTRLPPNIASIVEMLNELKIFEAQLREWHTSLPPSINFHIPDQRVEPLSDELCQYLRGRYLAIRELIYRPFVRICVNHSLDIPLHLLNQVVAAASTCLQYCSFRLQASTRTRHHGLWFQLRNFISCVLILFAAEKAQQSPNLHPAMRLELPTGWRELALEKKEGLGPYWNERRGGITNCARILDWALNDLELEGHDFRETILH